MGKSCKSVQFALSVCKRITSVRFFVNKRTNGKLPFARWANGKRIKENRLGFRFLFENDIGMNRKTEDCFPWSEQRWAVLDELEKMRSVLCFFLLRTQTTKGHECTRIVFTVHVHNIYITVYSHANPTHFPGAKNAPNVHGCDADPNVQNKCTLVRSLCTPYSMYCSHTVIFLLPPQREVPWGLG